MRAVVVIRRLQRQQNQAQAQKKKSIRVAMIVGKTSGLSIKTSILITTGTL